MDSLRKILASQLSNLQKLINPKNDVFIPSPEDFYLVSYPRSGNTWIRVILAELMYGEVVANLAEIEKYIPDLHFALGKKDIIQSEFHIVKSHNPYNSRFNSKIYKKVIYIIRDPRDVVISHFRYSKAHGYRNSFEDYIIDWVNGRIWPCSWQEHVHSWVGNSAENKNFNLCIIRYEDLLDDTYNNIRKLITFIGLQKSYNEIYTAISNSSLSNMKKKELSGLREGEDKINMQFIGKGKYGEWRTKLTSPQANLIYDHASKAMKMFNYE